MGVSVVLSTLRTMLNGVTLPGMIGTLEAFITPPDPREDPPPAAYIWSSRGRESRQSLPRNQTMVQPPGTGFAQAAFKTIDHTVDVYVTWFGEATAPDADAAFPQGLDGIMQILRTGPSPLSVTDPATGIQSELVDIGERMNYQLVPMRSVRDQRILRYDCAFTLMILEEFQA